MPKIGRPKGSKNIRSFHAEELARRLDVDPLEILLRVAAGDWAFFGFENQNKVIIGEKAGIEFSIEEPNIKITDRVQAAKDASKYLYSQKHAVDVVGEVGIKLIVEDYTKKKCD